MIRVLYFARLRERLGRDAEELALPEDAAAVADMIGFLQARGGDWAEVFGGGESLLMAVNQEMARPDSPLRDGDELAFFPPVTGG